MGKMGTLRKMSLIPFLDFWDFEIICWYHVFDAYCFVPAVLAAFFPKSTQSFLCFHLHSAVDDASDGRAVWTSASQEMTLESRKRCRKAKNDIGKQEMTLESKK